jgi:hypothetical protein
MSYEDLLNRIRQHDETIRSLRECVEALASRKLVRAEGRSEAYIDVDDCEGRDILYYGHIGPYEVAVGEHEAASRAYEASRRVYEECVKISRGPFSVDEPVDEKEKYDDMMAKYHESQDAYNRMSDEYEKKYPRS